MDRGLARNRHRMVMLAIVYKLLRGGKIMKVMISQPMRGKTNEQIRRERAEVVRNLKADGFEVIDTIVTEKPPKNSDEAIFYLAKSIEFISQVDVVYFMRGWAQARGCMIEHKICQEYGKQTMYNLYESEEEIR